MANRRTFIKELATLIAMSTLPISNSKGKLKSIGIQLFSLPKSLEQDFEGTVKMLAEMGYTELELFGPYPFSHMNNQEHWKLLAPMLGFSGSGYFGREINEIKAILEDHGMTSPSAHTDLDTLVHHMDRLGEAARVLGHQYVALPAIPDDRRKTTDDYKNIAALFNEIGAAAKKEGIRFAYHNHGYGLKPVDGKMPLEIIFDETDPELVFFEMDIFWTAAGGLEPVDLLKKYGNRYRLMHIKDMKPKTQFSGDGGDASQWMELFPLMTSAGEGELGVKEIIEVALQTGVDHFFVEQDLVADPEVALAKSSAFIKSI
jgi:sugar phosphate isomerase/epimerase